ncbi:hypothetical protein LEMLEM_LOCUS10185 [Lemmus lemmus]
MACPFELIAGQPIMAEALVRARSALLMAEKRSLWVYPLI